MSLIWTNEPARFSSGLDGSPAYMPVQHRIRWERLRQARMLFEGRHRQYFLDGKRTGFDYPEEENNGEVVRPYHTLNLLRLVSLKTADLMFGTKSRITAPSSVQTDWLDLLARRSHLHSRLHAAIVAASWSGGAFLEATTWRGEAYVEVVEPDEIYPLGPRMPSGQYERYVRYATTNAGTEGSPITLLLETTYEPGKIVRRLYQLDIQGEGSRREVRLSDWPAFADAAPRAETMTGLAENTIVYIPNEAGGRPEISDYDGLIGLQDTVNAKIAQIARVIAKHASPKIAVSEASADENGNLKASSEVFFYRTRDEIPSYITWSAELAAAAEDRTAAINHFCIAAEMSQILLGIKEGGNQMAAKTLRLEATNSLAKVGRKALLMEPAIAMIVEIAQRLDQTTALRRQYPVDPVGVEIRDGLPVDEESEANVIATLRGANSMSLEAAVERRVEDPDAAFAEVQRIRQEQAVSTPDVLMGETSRINSTDEEDE